MALLGPATEMSRKLRGLRPFRARDENLLLSQRVGPFAESFRLLALNVRRLMEGHSAKTLVVMSAFGGDGRSTVAANLAISIGEYGRVLLADFRPDALRDPGWLQDAITNGNHGGTGEGRHGLPDTMPGPLLGTGHPQVWFMDPGERVLAGGRLSETIRAAGENGMFTVIDSPPATESSDAYRLAEQAGKVLYVIRRKPQDMAVHRGVCDTLSRLGADVIGLVVNDF
ncbi:MAG: hypothetical protein Q7T33_03135 [Dehalococcoidia bacterium]|nr:hypothetical protein [Dehalococcoidia bacterium]